MVNDRWSRSSKSVPNVCMDAWHVELRRSVGVGATSCNVGFGRMEFNVPADESGTKDVVERRMKTGSIVANEVKDRAVELDSPGDVADEVEKRAVELDSPGDVTDDVEEQTDSASWSLMRKTS